MANILGFISADVGISLREANATLKRQPNNVINVQQEVNR